MCFFYQLSAKAQDLESRYNKSFPKEITYNKETIINAFAYPKMPIIIRDKKEIQIYNWGLIPHWAKDESIKKFTLNARIETISDKPAFRDSIDKPCLIPATGFFEWQWLVAKGKQKYFIKSTESNLFSFAGLYSKWVYPETGEEVNSFTILTTQANDLMSKIHNTKQRMPIILHKEDEKKWLEGKDYSKFALPYESNLLATILD